MAYTSILRPACLAGLLASVLACGGTVEEDNRASSAGTGGTGGSAAVPCEPPEAATIGLELTCSSFVPGLLPTEVTFVERTTVGAMQAHRFRASGDCGFDVVFSLPNLAFAADDQPYEMSTWWIQGAGPLGLLTAILRRSGDRTPLLAVAAEGYVDLMSNLLDPFAVILDGPPCSDSGDLVQLILTRDDSPLPCEDEAGGLRLCHDGDVAYRLVDYVGPPGSADVPAVMGNAELLTPVP